MTDSQINPDVGSQPLRSERDKMLQGELYDASDPELIAARRVARELLQQFNTSKEGDDELRQRIHRELFGAIGEALWIEPPFFCDYGQHIRLGDRVFFNFNCVILDPAEVTIACDVLFGPAVQIYTATHPLDYRIRQQWLEAAKPIAIGSDVWIGGGAIICPGVQIGDRAVIGAGSVVIKDIPPGVFAAGNPCRVLREVD
jgi:maltose O-acetyltransferase